jgi:rubrerythrin
VSILSKKKKDDDISEQLNSINDSLEQIKFNLVQLLGNAPKQEIKAKLDIEPIKELIDSMSAEMAHENTLIEILEKVESFNVPTQVESTGVSSEVINEIKTALEDFTIRTDVGTPDISPLSEKLEGFARQETVEAIQLELMKFPGNEIIKEIREGIKKATGFDEIETITTTISDKIDDNLSKINETMQNVESRLNRLDEFERSTDLLQTGVSLMDMQPTVEEIRKFVESSLGEKEALTKSREELLSLLKGLYEEIAKMREDIHELRAVESTLGSVKKFFDAFVAETDAYKNWEDKEESQ